jgi:hypothetical protein
MGTMLYPQKIEFIQFSKPAINEQMTALEYLSAVVVFPPEFNGTDVDGIGVPSAWDGKSLILNKTGTEEEEKILRSKLSFVSKSNDENPFNGIRHLENSKQRGNYLLFAALEFEFLGQHRDFSESLQTYIEELNKKEKNSTAHPLLLFALARQFGMTGQDQKAKQFLDAFAALYPDAVPCWLNQAERDDLFASSSTSAGKKQAGHSAKPTVEDEWESLKRNESCTSDAMEKLLKLTGLEKVKEFSISFFKTALRFNIRINFMKIRGICRINPLNSIANASMISSSWQSIINGSVLAFSKHLIKS